MPASAKQSSSTPHGMDEKVGSIGGRILVYPVSVLVTLQLIARFQAVLPFLYIVNWKKNLWIGVAVHWLLNAAGSLVFLFAVFNWQNGF